MPFVTKPVSILSFLVLLSSVTFTFATILPPYVHNPFAVQPYSYGFTSGRFLARAISEDPFINGQTLGQYHTPSGVSIANLYSAGGQASDRDYVYLTGEGSYELFLQWDRAPMGSNALYYAPDGENQPLVIKEAIESDDTLIKGLYTGGNSPLTHIVEGFTFTACVVPDGVEDLPRVYVSYLANKNNKLAPNCSPIILKAYRAIRNV